jgi:hypothetical protein
VFYLDQRSYVISIAQDFGRPVLDAVLLFTVRGQNITINNLFSKQDYPAQILNYTKVDPTKYEVSVDAKAPFWLFQAESYDPDWVAYVNGRPISAVLSYEAINAFPINVTGRLNITIEFALQRFFYYGSAVSIATLVILIALILFRPLNRRKYRFNR